MALFCPHCGSELEDGAQFCGFCGGSVGGRTGAGAHEQGGALRQEQSTWQEPVAGTERPQSFHEASTEVLPAAQSAPVAPVMPVSSGHRHQTVEGYDAATPAVAQPKKRKGPLIAVIVAIVAVIAAIVVVGFTTNWFGLAGSTAQGGPVYVMTSSVLHSDSGDETLLENTLDDRGNIVKIYVRQTEDLYMSTTYEYDENGNPTSGVSTVEYGGSDSSGSSSPTVSALSSETDSLGRPSKRTAGAQGESGHSETTYSYYGDTDSLSKSVQVVDIPFGGTMIHNTVVNEFDEDGLLTYLSYEYDADELSDGMVSLEWEKDNSGHPTFVTIADSASGKTVSCNVECDEHGNITRLDLPGDNSGWIEITWQLVENPTRGASCLNTKFNTGVLGGISIFGTSSSSDSDSSSSNGSSSSTDSGSSSSSTESGSSEGTFTSTTPVFTDIYASSELPGDDVTSYYGPLNAIDGKSNTAWNEGVDGNGVGEWIELSAPTKQTVSGIRIMGGYDKTQEIYYKNHRPRQVTITFDNGSTITGELSDSYNVVQDMKFDNPVQTRTVRITIDSVYEGSYYDDCCITEIEVY